jgi:hypothetical protein
VRNATYTIFDEPRPGTLARFAVDPFWPLLATMLCGTWLGASWFVFNAFALGSATRKSETWLAIASPVTSFGLLWLAISLVPEASLSAARPYMHTMLAVVRLSFAYAIWARQERSSALFAHYGGTLRKGILPLIGGFVIMSMLADAPSAVKMLLTF